MEVKSNKGKGLICNTITTQTTHVVSVIYLYICDDSSTSISDYNHLGPCIFFVLGNS